MYGVYDYVKRIVPETSTSFLIPPPPPFPLAGATVDLWFTQGMYYDSGSTVAVTSELSCSRASVAYAQTSAGALTQFATDTLRITNLGLLVEDARTNVVLWNQDLTNVAWTPTNITPLMDQTGPDGVANSASSLLATAGNGTILQSITLASSDRFQSAWVKRLIGSGTINMTMDNGATWTVITVTSSWTLVTIPTQTLANPTVGFRIVTNGDKIAVCFVQNENGTFATSPIPTTTTSAARAQDVVAGIGTVQSIVGFDVPQSGIVDFQPLTVLTIKNLIGDNGTSGDCRLFIGDADNKVADFISVAQGGAGTVNQAIAGAGLFSTGLKSGYSMDSGGTSLVCGGGTVATRADHGALNSNVVRFGTNTGVGVSNYGYYRRVTIWNSRLANTTLQGFTT